MVDLESVESVFSWMIDPVGEDSFFSQHWESVPLVLNRGDSDYFSTLLSLDQVDKVLTDQSVRYPDIQLVNSKCEIKRKDYATNRGAIDVAKLYKLFFEGSTVILDSLQERISNLGTFCRKLESQLCMPFQTNVYMTPPNAKGFKRHFDTHDVFILQIEGSKHWSFYESQDRLPLSGQDFDDSNIDRNAPSSEFDLHAGDLAYIPRGLVHDAQSTDEISLHITVGALAFTWTDFFLEAMSSLCLADDNFRKSLPIGFADSRFGQSRSREIFNKLCTKIVDGLDFDSTFELFVEEMAASQRPNLRGQMEQILRSERLSESDLVRVQSDLVVNFRQDTEFIRIVFLDNEIRFPIHAAEAIRFALDNSQFKIEDLPGNLDTAGKLVLIKRLVREGLVAIVI